MMSGVDSSMTMSSVTETVYWVHCPSCKTLVVKPGTESFACGDCGTLLRPSSKTGSQDLSVIHHISDTKEWQMSAHNLPPPAECDKECEQPPQLASAREATAGGVKLSLHPASGEPPKFDKSDGALPEWLRKLVAPEGPSSADKDETSPPPFPATGVLSVHSHSTTGPMAWENVGANWKDNRAAPGAHDALPCAPSNLPAGESKQSNGGSEASSRPQLCPRPAMQLPLPPIMRGVDAQLPVQAVVQEKPGPGDPDLVTQRPTLSQHLSTESSLEREEQVVGRAVNSQKAERRNSHDDGHALGVQKAADTERQESSGWLLPKMVHCENCRKTLQVPAIVPVDKKGRRRIKCGACLRVQEVRPIAMDSTKPHQVSMLSTPPLPPAPTSFVPPPPVMPHPADCQQPTTVMTPQMHQIAPPPASRPAVLPVQVSLSCATVPPACRPAPSCPNLEPFVWPPPPPNTSAPPAASPSAALDSAPPPVRLDNRNDYAAPSQPPPPIPIPAPASAPAPELAPMQMRMPPSAVTRKQETKQRPKWLNFFKTPQRNAQVAYQRRVVVNGALIPDFAVESAEAMAGPIYPGYFWYDPYAGFWGVMGGPCVGMIPPNIQEFSSGELLPHASAGDTGVIVNGRELHRDDLAKLKTRGLSPTPGKGYIVDNLGNVWDGVTRKQLKGLGKLAPSLGREGRGKGMFVPNGVTIPEGLKKVYCRSAGDEGEGSKLGSRVATVSTGPTGLKEEYWDRKPMTVQRWIVSCIACGAH